jgi:RNAse (barnase) inhibitor barstar
MARVTLDTSRMADWASFHDECQRAFGFPEFYGRNMDAWIDCLSSLRDHPQMTRFMLAAGEKLEIEVPNAPVLDQRVPELMKALVECSAFVNLRYVELGEEPALALVFL